MQRHIHPTRQSGFTLVQMAMVLIIISLVVAGILVGKDMIAAAKLRKVAADIDSFNGAVSLFMSKYNAFPGDFANATQMWGADPEGCPNPSSTQTSVTRVTCNGDGDGVIGPRAAGWDYHDANVSEWLRFWQHLSDAGLISGSYSSAGNYSWPEDWAYPTFNIGQGQYQDCGHMIYEIMPGHSAEYLTPDKVSMRYVWMAGALDCYNPSGFNSRPAFPPSVARSIDAKLDDGKPFTGAITGSDRDSFDFCGVNATGLYRPENYIGPEDYVWVGCALYFTPTF